MRRYETIFITHPELSEEDQTALLEKVRSILTAWQGDEIKLEDWGARKLGYEIRKSNRGHYFLLDYLALPELVRELERNLRLNDRVLKYQTIKIGGEVLPQDIPALKAKPPEKAPQPSEPSHPPEAPGRPAMPEEGEAK